MSRKELYAKVKELGVADIIKTRLGDNYTRVSNADLEAFLKDFSKKTTKKEAAPKKEKKEATGSCKEAEEIAAMIKLLSTLQAKRTLTAKEAEEIAAML